MWMSELMCNVLDGWTLLNWPLHNDMLDNPATPSFFSLSPWPTAHLSIPFKRCQPVVDVGHEVASPDGALACVQSHAAQRHSVEDVRKLPLLGVDLLQSKVESLQELEAVLRVDVATVKHALSFGVNIKHACTHSSQRQSPCSRQAIKNNQRRAVTRITKGEL